MHPFRVFVSYAHKDRALAARLHRFLCKLGLINLWDPTLDPAEDFTEAIQTRIARSHLLIPLFTRRSIMRPWLHQEAGYALGLRVPVLSVAAGRLPSAMLAGYQAVKVGPRLGGLHASLNVRQIERAILPPGHRPSPPFEWVRYPESRTELVVRYAEEARHMTRSGLSGLGRLRERAQYSSFSIPQLPADYPVWKRWKGSVRVSESYLEALWKQRVELERHAKKHGCHLIISPFFKTRRARTKSRRTQIRLLLDFLQDTRVRHVHVAIRPRVTPSNLLVVGDWFTAEAVKPRWVRGWHHTNFTWHAPYVLTKLREFDEEFEELLAEQPGGRAGSRDYAIDVVQRELSQRRRG